MSRVRKNLTIWTCDSCGEDVEVGDMGDGRPPGKLGWRQFLIATLDAKMGNLPAKHLCGSCVAEVEGVLSGTLGDLDALWQAWDEGFAAHMAGAFRQDNPHTKD